MSGQVRVLGTDEVAEAVSVLCEAFHDYPVMRFVLGSDGPYTARVEALITFFVTARLLRGETVLGAGAQGHLGAAALVSNPLGPPSPPELATLRDETWAQLGEGARSRYDAFGSAASAFPVEAPHIHLNMIGVRRAEQGSGLGRALLEDVHARSAADATSTGVSLTTEVHANVSLYRHFGYELIGRATVGRTLTTWVMVRPDRAVSPVDG